jgi:hypothetical protein
MDKNESVDVLVYGLMVVGLNLVAHRINPAFAVATLPFLVSIGVLIMLTGVLGLRGFRRRSWPIGTITVAAGLHLVQAARAWFAVKSGVDGMKPVAVIFSLLLFFAIMQLVTLARPAWSLRVERGRSAAKDNGVNEESQNGTGPKHGVER